MQTDIKQQIKTYLDEEGIVNRSLDDIWEIVRQARGDPKKLEAAVRKGYRGLKSEQEFYDNIVKYSGDAPAYDLLSGRSRGFQEWILEKIASRGLEDKKALDVGCGTGVVISLFGELGAKEVVGIDVNKSLLNEAQKRIKRRNLNNVKTIVGDRDNLIFTDNYFDFITCLNSIVTEGEFWGPQADILYNHAVGGRIKQIGGVLKKGGIATVAQCVSPGYEGEYKGKFSYWFKEAGVLNILEQAHTLTVVDGDKFAEVLVSARK